MGACTSNKKRKEIQPPVNNVNKLNNEEKTILQLQICRDNIKAYIKRLTMNEDKRKQKAKEEVKLGNREKAKIYLSQSKLYKEQATVATGQLTMIQEQVDRIHSAAEQREVIKVLEMGNKVLKDLNEEVNIDKWERIADDMNELKSQQDEIGNFLKNHNIDEQTYEDEINNELERMMQGMQEQLPDAGQHELVKPDAVQHEVVKPEIITDKRTVLQV
jgi:charged multivesicular body protein 6